LIYHHELFVEVNLSKNENKKDINFRRWFPGKIYLMSNASTGNTCASLSSRYRFLTEMSSIMIEKKVKSVYELIRFTFHVQKPCFEAAKITQTPPWRPPSWMF